MSFFKTCTYVCINDYFCHAQMARKKLVMDVFRGVFPIEVEPLSEEDAGDEGEWDLVQLAYLVWPNKRQDSCLLFMNNL